MATDERSLKIKHKYDDELINYPLLKRRNEVREFRGHKKALRKGTKKIYIVFPILGMN